MTKHLLALKRQADMVRARVRGAAMGYSNGLLLYGPPGVGKSFLVEQTLRDNGSTWAEAPKGLTPQGLLEFFKDHGSEIMLFDDVAELFRNERGRKYMMAACGTRPDHTQVRHVSYSREGSQVDIPVSGCCIILTNDDSCPKAFASRVPVLEYSPSQEQIAALMRRIVREGITRGKWHLTADECRMVTEYLISEAEKEGVPLDLRDLMEKSLPDYAMWKAGLSKVLWKDMVRAHLFGKIG